MDKLRIGVIGAGGFAEICHVPGLQSHPQAEVVALCGRRREHAVAMAQRLGVPEVHTDWRELVARDDLDGLAIVTPNVNHAEIALAACMAGKHVFCEKPLGMNADESGQMLRAAQAGGRVHMVAFTFRYLHCTQTLRRLLRAGAIGRPHYVRVRGESMGGLSPNWKIGWREAQALSGGGLVQDMGSHYLDLVNWIVSPIAEICGTLVHVPRLRPEAATGDSRPVETDDLNAAFFRTQSGLPGDYLLSRVTPAHGEWGFEVVGDEGALFCLLTRGNRDELRLLRIGPAGTAGHDWETVPLAEEAKVAEPLALGRMMRAFVDAILRGAPDSEVDATFADGHGAQQAIDAIHASVRERRWMAVPLGD